MAGHSRSKNGVFSHAYVPAIHVSLAVKTWMHRKSGLPDFRINTCRKSGKPDLP
jgi:hypothetical protein